MAFKEVSSLDADVTVALGKVDKKTGKKYPTQAEGYYLGARVVDDERKQSNRPPSRLHFLQTAGGNLGVWGTTDLDRKLGQVTIGSMVRITFTGKKPTKNGDMYTYKVESDDNNTIEVSTDSVSYADESSDEDTSYVASANYSNGHNEEDEDTAQAEALAAAERKAKLEALLKNAGKGKPAKN